MIGITTTVGPVHFEDFSGEQFERLVYAYYWRTQRFDTLEWLGQLGSDAGRDILGVTQSDYGRTETWCIQCANRKSLTYKKASDDMEKACNAATGKPDHFRFVIRSSVSAAMRGKIKKRADELELWDTQILTGVEFEERLRSACESLLRRFCIGEAFPDDPAALRAFIMDTAPANDQEWLAINAQVFDRPAFTTPFSGESSLPAFKQAITDTIEALNTGKYYNRRGDLIRDILPRHKMTDPTIKEGLASIVRHLTRLRRLYDEFIVSGDIRPCECHEDDCPVHMISHKAEETMERERHAVLDEYRLLWAPFDVTIGW
ncbi:MAG: hypothetical protein WCP21_17380 [Armatimonadota bacterium]